MASRRFPLLTAILALCGCMFAAGLHAAESRPDYYAARAFAAELQQDFNQRNCIALLDRLDREALRLRVFRPLGTAMMEDGRVRAAWTSSLLPAVEDQIQHLDHMSTLAVGRVILLADGDRALECIFFDDKDAFRLLTLRLQQAPDGHIGICDLKSLGSALDASHRIRQSLLLRGLVSNELLSDEEMDLQRCVERDRPQIFQTLHLLDKGDAAEAYRVWSNVSEDLQQSAMGRELRAQLAEKGSKKAAEAMRADWREHPAANPFAAYSLAVADHDLPRAMAALDLVLEETQQLAFLRGVKAGLLLQTGHTEEALRLAQNVCELTPINGASYLTAITAAAELQRPQVALELLQRWNHVSTTQGIDSLLKTQAGTFLGLKTFLKSAAYQDWHREAAKPLTQKGE